VFEATNVGFRASKFRFEASDPVFEASKFRFGASDLVFETSKFRFGASDPAFETSKFRFGASNLVFETSKFRFGASDPVFETSKFGFGASNPAFGASKSLSEAPELASDARTSAAGGTVSVDRVAIAPGLPAPASAGGADQAAGARSPRFGERPGYPTSMIARQATAAHIGMLNSRV